MKLIRDEKGLAMPLALIVLVVLTLLGFALWQYSMSELNNSVREEKRARAYYIARAGAESVARHLIHDPEVLMLIPAVGDGIEPDDITFEIDFPDNAVGELDVLIERIEANKVEVTGIGMVDGIVQKVSLILETEEQFEGDSYFLNSANFQQNATLTGNYVSGGSINPPNTFTGSLKEDSTILFHTPIFRAVPEYTGIFTVEKDGNKSIPGDPDYNTGQAYEKIFIGHSAYLKINASSGPVFVETKYFEMHNNAKMLELATSVNSPASETPEDNLVLYVDEIDLKQVKVTGNGVAYIFVRSKINIQTPHAEVDDTAKLFIYLDKGAIMEIHAGSHFEGLVYGPEAIVEIGGDADFVGGMIVEHLKGRGGNFTIGSAGTDIGPDNKYSWDFLGLDHGGYWMVQWTRN